MDTIPYIDHWHSLAIPPPLPRGGLHLWRICTGPGGAKLAHLWPLLSERESERARRLRLPEHRERYVRAQAGLRSILAIYINVAPQLIEFKYGNAGKPLLPDKASSLEFNLTTSGDLALAAISAGEPVGVDCEKIREHRDVTAIAKRMFTSVEASRIASAPEHERLGLFHLAWTALEANVKADGRGLFRHTEPAAQGTLEIGHCVPEQGFIAAVARRDLPPVEHWKTFELAAS